MIKSKDYQTTARILFLSKNDISHGAYLDLVYNFVDWFAEDNPDFDETKFVNACGLDVQNVNVIS